MHRLLLSATRIVIIFLKYCIYVKKNEVSGSVRLWTNYPLKTDLSFKWQSLIFLCFKRKHFLFSHNRCLNLLVICIYIFIARRKYFNRDCTYLHDPIPVVPCGHPEEGEKGHAEVGESRMSAQTFTRVFFTAVCGTEKQKQVSEATFASSYPEQPPKSGSETLRYVTLICGVREDAKR